MDVSLSRLQVQTGPDRGYSWGTGSGPGPGLQNASPGDGKNEDLQPGPRKIRSPSEEFAAKRGGMSLWPVHRPAPLDSRQGFPSLPTLSALDSTMYPQRPADHHQRWIGPTELPRAAPEFRPPSQFGYRMPYPPMSMPGTERYYTGEADYAGAVDLRGLGVPPPDRTLRSAQRDFAYAPRPYMPPLSLPPSYGMPVMPLQLGTGDRSNERFRLESVARQVGPSHSHAEMTRSQRSGAAGLTLEPQTDEYRDAHRRSLAALPGPELLNRPQGAPRGPVLQGPVASAAPPSPSGSPAALAPPGVPSAPTPQGSRGTTSPQSAPSKPQEQGLPPVRKRRTGDERSGENARTWKKPRLQWTDELHQLFVKAVEKAGGVNNAMPKQLLLDMRSVDGLSRENVASHLQKYRSKLKMAEKETAKKCGAGSETVNRKARSQDNTNKGSDGTKSS